jgi:hypothetical protein
MNYAAADVTSPRSVLAYCMPPVFLAFVVDRVVRTIQRHVLGMHEARSPWSALADTARRATRLWLLSVLYVLRFAVDRRNTCAGLKQAILNATPLPERPAIEAAGDEGDRPRCEQVARSTANGVVVIECGRELPCPDHPHGAPALAKPAPIRRKAPAGARGGLTKTERLVIKVKQRHGSNIAAIPRDQISRIATELAPEVGMHPASARTALLAVYREELPAGEGDAR